MNSNSQEILAYIGTYTRGSSGSKGIYVHRLDLASGALEPTGLTAETPNPSFLAIHPTDHFLYSVSVMDEGGGQPAGGVSAFAMDPESGALTFLNRQSSEGVGPCHVTVDGTGMWLLVANYGSGGVAVLPIEEGGHLAPASDAIQHEGSSVHPQRQTGPHAHSINLDPTNRFAFVPDLGMDKVMIYKLNIVAGRLISNEQPWVEVKPGAGPRHFTFHPNMLYAYVINEIDSSITAFAYDMAKGTLTAVQTVPTLPDGFDGENTTADIHVHPSGQFLYGSNRGHDSIAIFEVDEATGKLMPIGHESTQGKTPRNFGIDPTGTFLLAANQNSDTIVSFRIDTDTGKLTPTGQIANVPSPVCVKMIPWPRETMGSEPLGT